MEEMEKKQEMMAVDPAWCERMENLAREQAKYAKGQFVCSCISLVIKVLVLVAIVVLVAVCAPKVAEVAEQAQGALAGFEDMMNGIKSLSESMKSFAAQNSDTSAVLDVQKLNEAMGNLSQISEKLAKFFGN